MVDRVRSLLAFLAIVASLGLVALGPSALAARNEAGALALARAEAQAASRRADALDRQARAATNAADRASAQGAAIAARITAAEAGLTASERRIALLQSIYTVQRARLAERQGPLIRLTAALQTMARRPPALALVQPGSVQDTVHVRSLLAAILPEIRRRTADLRAEVDRSNRLKTRFEQARGALLASRGELQRRRVELARFEVGQRSRSRELSGLALAQSDRALAFGEEARTLSRIEGDRAFQARLAASLSDLPGPVPRPGSGGGAPPATPYRLPVEGRLLRGVGEISDGGVHSRGLHLAPEAGAAVVAPARGRIAYAAPFRGYGNVVIIDHGRGWTTVVTNLDTLDVARGRNVAQGARLGRAAAADPRITVELRRNGRPVPIARLVRG